MVVDAMLLPVAFDDQSRFARSVGFGLEDPFEANHMISDGYVCSQNLFPCSVFEERRIFFLDGCPLFQLIRAGHGPVESRWVDVTPRCGTQCACGVHLAK
jgi:hypothetical protein